MYNWTPKTFDCNITAAEETSDIAKEGKKKPGYECEPDHVGITCEGEVSSGNKFFLFYFNFMSSENNFFLCLFLCIVRQM